MKQRLISLLLSLVLLVCLLPGLPRAAAAPLEGTLESGLRWYLEDGTLTISGSGPIPDCLYELHHPWYAHRNEITKLVVKDGVTELGNRCFEKMENLTAAELPDSVTRIGEFTFFRCRSLVDYSLPAGLTDLGRAADSFGPGSSCTRAQVVTFLFRAAEAIAEAKP